MNPQTIKLEIKAEVENKYNYIIVRQVSDAALSEEILHTFLGRLPKISLANGFYRLTPERTKQLVNQVSDFMDLLEEDQG